LKILNIERKTAGKRRGNNGLFKYEALKVGEIIESLK